MLSFWNEAAQHSMHILMEPVMLKIFILLRNFQLRLTFSFSSFDMTNAQLLQSMRSCQVGLNSIHFKTLKTAKIVLTFLLISQE